MYRTTKYYTYAMHVTKSLFMHNTVIFMTVTYVSNVVSNYTLGKMTSIFWTSAKLNLYIRIDFPGATVAWILYNISGKF